MSLSNLLTLILLAAIWGGSFLFLRIAVPVLGPVWVVEGRVLLAAVFLLGMAIWRRRFLNLRQDGWFFLIVGGLNSAVPFLLFAWAAQSVSASLLSILNATTPIWGAVLNAIWTRTGLSLKTVIGLVLGVAGVAALVGFEGTGHGAIDAKGMLAVLAALTAAFCYGLAATITRASRQRHALDNAHGSMWASVLVLSPALLFAPVPAAVPEPVVALAVLMLGVVCSGIAYVLFFGLIEKIGTAPTLSVTFLIPVFGVLWGALFLHEPIGWPMLVGALLVLTGTALITGFSPRTLFRKTTVAG